MKEKVLITAALPYANGPLHFGHIAGAYLPADCYARFKRMQGSDVLFICGSDEYGIAITLSAELAGRSPKNHGDIYHAINKAFFDKLSVSFDHYSRTTNPYHEKFVQQFFLDLLHNGYIEKRKTLQLYSEPESKFLADRYVVGVCPKCGFEKARGDECPSCGASYEAIDLINPRSKLTGSELVKKETTHWFLLFDKFKEPLMKWMQKKHWKPSVSNFAKSYVEDLKPRAITRDSSWGIPVPLEEAEGKVLYVWFDAPIGYVSATKDWAEAIGAPDRWKDYWLDDHTRLVQFVGKDNIPFHAVFFPAMEMGQNLPLKIVDDLPANEFYNLEGRQFSKSDGWFIDLEDFFRHYSTDQIRYVIAANAPEFQDSEFTWKDFQLRCNSELLGKYGNLVNRVLVFVQQQCSGIAPDNGILEAEDEAFLAKIKDIVFSAEQAYSHYHLRKACQAIMELAQVANVYFDAQKPWQTAKNSETRPRMLATLYCCIEAIKLLAIISFPVIPDSAQKVWQMLGYTGSLEKIRWSDVVRKPFEGGVALPKPEVLFSKIEDERIRIELEKLQQLSCKPEMKKQFSQVKPEISFEDVSKIDLRIAKVLEATRIAKSKKLLRLVVDLGFEQRTIVAGIGDKVEDLSTLIGRSILVVANLKTATLMGVESQGMVLAAVQDKSLELPGCLSMLPGTSVS